MLRRLCTCCALVHMCAHAGAGVCWGEPGSLLRRCTSLHVHTPWGAAHAALCPCVSPSRNALVTCSLSMYAGSMLHYRTSAPPLRWCMLQAQFIHFFLAAFTTFAPPRHRSLCQALPPVAPRSPAETTAAAAMVGAAPCAVPPARPGACTPAATMPAVLLACTWHTAEPKPTPAHSTRRPFRWRGPPRRPATAAAAASRSRSRRAMWPRRSAWTRWPGRCSRCTRTSTCMSSASRWACNTVQAAMLQQSVPHQELLRSLTLCLVAADAQTRAH